jgi:hypothetical protein
MNVLNIPKQSDKPLIYTSHAKMRSYDKDIPKPKYVPLNARLVERQWDIESQSTFYKLEFTFNERPYILVVSSEWEVVTMYGNSGGWRGQTKEYSKHRKMVDKLRKYPTPYKRTSKYRHLEFTSNCEEYNYA